MSWTNAVAAICFCLLAIVAPSFSQDLTVAAAADLRSTLDVIASRFEAKSGAHVKLVYGSSGNFYQQIQNGAPFDLFLSANSDYPRKLQSAGLAVEDSYVEYARGKLVLLVPAGSKLDLDQGLRVLLNPEIRKVAIADPSHAPYGQAAVAALKAEGLYQAVSAKIVTGENVSQAASFVLSGTADAGMVALSLVISGEKKSSARYVEIPPQDYPPIRQASIVLRSSKNQKSAMQFQGYLRSAEAIEIFRQYGFEVAMDTK